MAVIVGIDTEYFCSDEVAEHAKKTTNWKFCTYNKSSALKGQSDLYLKLNTEPDFVLFLSRRIFASRFYLFSAKPTFISDAFNSAYNPSLQDYSKDQKLIQ